MSTTPSNRLADIVGRHRDETTTLIEQMVLLTIDEYQKGREATIHHGQQG
jgi:hypothetical protein